MKKPIKIILIVIPILIAAFILLRWQTKKHSPFEKVVWKENQVEVAVSYCKPSKKGRIIFGDAAQNALQPYGKYWRIGANEATVFETNTTLQFNGGKLQPGKYQLYAYPQIDTWQLIFNTDYDRWGATEPDKSKDVLILSVNVQKSEELIEQLNIQLLKDTASPYLEIMWDDVYLMIPFSPELQ
jgi:hypothetical protein